MYEDDKSGIYNIHLCRICQNPKKLDLVQSSDASESADGLSCWETLKYIFCEIIWVEDRLLSLICKNCVKNVYETARFKKVCLETNRQRDKFNNSYIELVNEPICNEKQTETDIFHETHEIEVGKPTKIEEVIVPSNEKIEMFLKSENMDDYEASSENMLEDLKVIDVPSAMADVKENDILPPVPKLKRALEKVTPPRRDPVIIKKIKKCNTIPNNVTIISSQLSEFMPYTNPRSNDTICKICQSIFATSIELREHVNSQHTMMPRRYRCESCHIGFYTLDEFQCHYREAKHNDYLPMQCEKCGCKTIRDQEQCRNRMQCHCVYNQGPDVSDKKRATDDRIRKILCMHCNSCFANLRLAKEHVAREHIAIRPFNCTKCNGSFLSKKLLLEHNVANHCIRCQLCSQTFDSNELLQKHKKRDHTERLNIFQCNTTKPPQGLCCLLCKKVFTSRLRLTKHIASRACAQYGTCTICGTNVHETKIKQHLATQHNINLHNVSKYFKRKIMPPITNKEPSNVAKQCEQYRECNLCAKYLHISQIRTHLTYSHHVNVNERGFKLQPYFKSRVLPRAFVTNVETVKLTKKNEGMLEEEHAYSKKMNG